jgi:transaldolase
MVDKDLNFSLWLDFIEREFLENKFGELVESGVVNGATSNPSIFASAITGSSAYAEQISRLSGATPKEKYEALAVSDIKRAAEILRPLYDEGNDGFISIEIDPFLSHNSEKSIEEALRLFKAIGEPNVMIKVPATDAGYPVMRELLGMGICVNATLVFSPEQARACLKAMRDGIDEFENTGGERVNAVISIFVSRFDRMLDPILEEKGMHTGLTGIMNAAKIYNLIQRDRIPSVRALFASTGVKDDSLPEDYYIRQLYAPHSVNTAPLSTIEAFERGEEPIPALPFEESEIEEYFESLEKAGISMQEVRYRLLEDGLKSFEESFAQMLKGLES